MVISKFTVSRDEMIYEAWHDLTVTPSGKLICFFLKCAHHAA